MEVTRAPDDREYNKCCDWITIDTPKVIKDKLRERNQVHFGQAKDSFPTIPPFSKWIDWGASAHQAELILEGNFTSAELDHLSQDLMCVITATSFLSSKSINDLETPHTFFLRPPNEHFQPKTNR